MKEIIEYVKVRYFSTMSEKGQGIVEYALILAFVVVVAAAITNSGGEKELPGVSLLLYNRGARGGRTNGQPVFFCLNTLRIKLHLIISILRRIIL